MNHDERLATLLDRVTRQRHQGQPPDFDALAREHPDLVAELRQLLNVAQLAEQFGSAQIAQPENSQRTLDQPRRTPAAAPALPRTFDGYELLCELGRGAMGVVYKAWDPRLKRFVALKMLLRGEQASAKERARFLGEAQALAKLGHRNIVPVFQVGECAGQAYFSMQYVEGTTLAALVRAGPLALREAARLVAAIARGVEQAHQAGILHRDLKPSNVLIDEDGEPLVTDFGLAKLVHAEGRDGASAAGELTATGAIVGTPSYMAPEQAVAATGSAQPTCDVYSLGAILYELLTGRPPFQAASAVAVLLLVRSEEVVWPRLLNPGIDVDLELICLKCLEKRPEHRYASAGKLAADLDAFLAGEAVSARSSSLAYWFSRLLRETYHAPVMENWGGLWMLHSLMLLLLCVVTNVMWLLDARDHLAYLALWSGGLVFWGLIFWSWRRRAGAVTFVERQMAHGWAAGVAASIGIFVVEILLHRPVLELTPVLSVVGGMVFIFMAGTVSGWFYVPAVLCFAGAVVMALLPEVAPTLFGLIAALGFFVPGLKYYRKTAATKRGEW